MIHITEEIKVTKIYLVTNCYGDPNKVYIGKEKSHQKTTRKSKHLKTYGKEIDFTYIDECEGWSKLDWKPLETFWIRYFKFLGFIVLNGNEGGGGSSFCSEEKRLKISKINKGKKFSKEWKDKISKSRKGFKHTQKSKNKMSMNNPNSKSILQYNRKGEFIKEWYCMMEVERVLGINQGSIARCCVGKIKTSGNYIWRFKENPLKLNFELVIYKHILQCDLDGNVIKEWNTQKDASKSLNIVGSSINICLKGKGKTAGGFIWKYKN